MKLLSRCAGSTRAPPGGRVRARGAHARQHAAQRGRIAGDRRRTERGHAVARQPLRHRGDRARRPSSVSSPFDAVHVHVDEPGNDVVIGERRSGGRAGESAQSAPGRMSTMRSPSRTSVPPPRTRSGSTRSAPDRTDHADSVDAPGARRRAAIASGPSVENSTRRSFMRVGRQPPRAFQAHRLEHQIRGGDAAADDDHFGIDRRGERRDRHADVLRGVAHDRDGDAVAAARAVEDVLAGDRVERSAGRLEHARAIAGLDAPRRAGARCPSPTLPRRGSRAAIVLALDRD